MIGVLYTCARLVAGRAPETQNGPASRVKGKRRRLPTREVGGERPLHPEEPETSVELSAVSRISTRSLPLQTITNLAPIAVTFAVWTGISWRVTPVKSGRGDGGRLIDRYAGPRDHSDRPEPGEGNRP